MKTKTIAKILRYTVILEPADEGGYVAYVPALPGCVTQGDSIDDALAMARDAISGYLDVLREDGDPLPLEQPGRVISELTVPVP